MKFKRSLSHLALHMNSQKVSRLSPSLGKRHDRPVIAIEWASLDIGSDMIVKEYVSDQCKFK
jgi:hypothetical protein